MTFVRLLAALLLLATPALGEPARVVRVVDGDSVHVTMRGLPVKVRLAGVDTPEIRHARCPSERARAEAAAAFVRSLLPVGAEVDVRPVPARDKYGRTIAAISVGGVDLAGELLQRGLGVAYSGGRRRDWCR